MGCLFIVAYIGFLCFRECKKYHKKLSSMFDEILILSIISILFDGVTETPCHRCNALRLSGRDAVGTFDPMIAEVFLDSRENVKQIHNEINTKQ